jgi:hypothetical protein
MGHADAERALRTLNQWGDLGVYFCETPLPLDDLDGIAKLSAESPVRIAFGEMQSHHSEFYDLFDRGGIQVGQPDVGRVGGLNECLKVCDMALERERIIVPHCWKTGVGIAATMQMAAVTPHCAYIEFLPAAICASRLRQKLTTHDPEFRSDGTLALPTGDGLGIAIDWETVREFDHEKVLRDHPSVAQMFKQLRSPMGPDHDIWDGPFSYGQQGGGACGGGGGGGGGGSPWVQRPALTLLGVGAVLGGLGVKLARL